MFNTIINFTKSEFQNIYVCVKKDRVS